jgi:phosphoglycolate phosphatase-like HAD superfamily hydrolase
MTRSGAASFLLERYAGRLEPHTPWSFERREATVMLRGLVDTAEVARALSDSGYGALELLDNGRLARTYGSLEAPEARLYHLVPRGVGKASGLRLHRKLSGLPVTETAAVGDSISDLDMASEVGTFFLVGGRSQAAALETGRVPNARRTEKAAGEGFAEAVASLLAGEVMRDT